MLKRYVDDTTKEIYLGDETTVKVYHGTANIIDRFDSGFGGKHTYNNQAGAFYFTDEFMTAVSYSRSAIKTEIENLIYSSKTHYEIAKSCNGWLENDLLYKKLTDDDRINKKTRVIEAEVTLYNPIIIDYGFDELTLDTRLNDAIVNMIKTGSLYYEDDLGDPIDLYERLPNFFNTYFKTYDETDVINEWDNIQKYADAIDAKDALEKDINNYVVEEYMSETRNDVLDLNKLRDIDGLILKNCHDSIEDDGVLHTVYVLTKSFNINILRNIIGDYTD